MQQSFQVDIRPGFYPQKSIVKLNGLGQKHGEEFVYEFWDHDKVPDLETLNTDKPWKLIASRTFNNGLDEGVYRYFFDEEFTDRKGCCYFNIKSEKHIKYTDDDTCVKTLYRNGAIIENIPHINEVPHGICTFWSRPYIHEGDSKYKWYEEYTYNNGVKEGPANCYKPDGSLYKSYTYVNGKKHGEYKKFYSSGQLKLIRYLDNGERCGIETCFYENGTIHWTVVYDRDVPGTKHTYREDGTLKEVEDMDSKYNWCPRNIETTYYKEDGVTVDRVWKTRMTGKYDYARGQHHSTLLMNLETCPEQETKSLIITNA